MAMVEPVINWDNFIEDVNNGLSAYDLQHKYTLTPRQYRWIMRHVQRKEGYSLKKTRVQPYTRRSYFNEPYITKRKNGRYIIRKGKVYYGQYATLEIAKKVKQELIKSRWDKGQLNTIRMKLGLKPLRSYD